MAIPQPQPEDDTYPGDLDLGSLDGKHVVATAVKVTNAGDGLSQAMKMEPQLLTHGQKVTLIIEAVVTNVGFPAVSKDTPDLLTRVHTLRAGTVAVLDTTPKAIQSLLDKQAERIEAAKGIKRLFPADGVGDDLYDEDTPDAMVVPLHR